MERGWWCAVGDANMTEYWRSVVPALSVNGNDDQTGLASDHHRVARVRRRYARELKHLTKSGPGSTWVTSGLTRIDDWSPLTEEEREVGRPYSPFALCRGVPSGLLATASSGGLGELDFAILVSRLSFCPRDRSSSTGSRWSYAATGRFDHCPPPQTALASTVGNPVLLALKRSLGSAR